MRCIVASGFPYGPLERASDEGHRAVTAGSRTAASAFGRDEQRPILATTGVVVEVNRVLYEHAGQACFGQHLAQTDLTGLKFRNRHTPVLAIWADDV